MQKQYSSPAFTGWQQLQSKAVLIIKEKNCQEKEWYILYKLRVNMSHCNFGNKGKAANPDYPSIFTVYSAFYIMTAGMQAFCVSVHLLLAFEVSPYNINCFTKCAAPLCFPCRLTEMENLFYVIPVWFAWRLTNGRAEVLSHTELWPGYIPDLKCPIASLLFFVSLTRLANNDWASR